MTNQNFEKVELQDEQPKEVKEFMDILQSLKKNLKNGEINYKVNWEEIHWKKVDNVTIRVNEWFKTIEVFKNQWATNISWTSYSLSRNGEVELSVWQEFYDDEPLSWKVIHYKTWEIKTVLESLQKIKKEALIKSYERQKI